MSIRNFVPVTLFVIVVMVVYFWFGWSAAKKSYHNQCEQKYASTVVDAKAHCKTLLAFSKDGV